MATAGEPDAGKLNKKPMPLLFKIIIGFVVAAILFAGAGYVALSSMKGTPPVAQSDAPSANVLKNIPGDPGATAQYDSVQGAANASTYEAAKDTNQSNLPTLRRADLIDPKPSVAPADLPVPSEQHQALVVRELVGQRMSSARKQYEEALKRSDGGNDSYRGISVAFALPVIATKTGADSRDAAAAVPTKKVGGVVLKSGDRLTAEVDATVNSDFPGPVFATVKSGLIAGARLKGEFKLVSDKVRLEFQSVMLPNQPKPQAVSALAFDLNSTTYGLATEVDRHLLERYSGVFLSALASAGQTLLQPRSTVTSLVGGAAIQTSERASYGDMSRSVAATGLAQVGQDLAQVGKRPTTAVVRQFELVGIVMTESTELDMGKANE